MTLMKLRLGFLNCVLEHFGIHLVATKLRALIPNLIEKRLLETFIKIPKILEL